jgi:hypothetical protein
MISFLFIIKVARQNSSGKDFERGGTNFFYCTFFFSFEILQFFFCNSQLGIIWYNKQLAEKNKTMPKDRGKQSKTFESSAAPPMQPPA